MTIQVSDVRRLLHAFNSGCEFIGMSQPSDGIVNQIHFLQTSQGEIVLRTFDTAAAQWKLHKERVLYSYMRSLGIPAPEVLMVDDCLKIVPFIYSLSERIKGESYARLFDQLSSEENSALYSQLGDYIGRLHATPFDQFGEIDQRDKGLVITPLHNLYDNSLAGPFTTWIDTHSWIVGSYLRLMENTEFSDLIPVAEHYFDSNKGLIDYAVTPRLLHLDLHRGNILVHNGKIVAILDIEESIVGHNEYDLMRTELANFRNQPVIYEQAFMDAYKGHIPLDKGYEERKAFYDASRTLVWIKSLILYGQKYSKGKDSQSNQAARNRLFCLIDS
jgi:aminoglycoside phosphotransferase (APT) family kinase protein